MKDEDKIKFDKHLANLLNESFPEEKEFRKAKLIQIIKEGFYAATLENEVRKYLEDNATLVKEEYKGAGLKDFVATGGKILGLTSKVYEIEGKGKIFYDEADIIGKYAVAIRLAGFDKEDETYKILETKFQEFADRDTLFDKEKGF